jgi:hypothetical protein
MGKAIKRALKDVLEHQCKDKAKLFLCSANPGEESEQLINPQARTMCDEWATMFYMFNNNGANKKWQTNNI